MDFEICEVGEHMLRNVQTVMRTQLKELGICTKCRIKALRVPALLYEHAHKELPGTWTRKQVYYLL